MPTAVIDGITTRYEVVGSGPPLLMYSPRRFRCDAGEVVHARRIRVVPGRDPSHATSAARYLEECLPKAEYWDVLPEGQTEQTAPARVLQFLDGVVAGSR